MAQGPKSPGATPGPWKYADGRVILAGAVDADGYAVDPVIVAEAFREAQYKDGRPNPIAPWERDANLQRIVECVNGYPDLLWERDALRAALLSVVKQAERNGFHEAEGDDGYDFRDALDAARAALAAGGAK